MADSWHFQINSHLHYCYCCRPCFTNFNSNTNFIQNWTKDAHTIWVTQVQKDEKVQDKIQRLETAIWWVWGQLIALLKQILLNCGWNPTQDCITLETFAEHLTDKLSGLDPRGWFENISYSIGSETITLVTVLVITFVVYQCLSTKIVQTKQAQLVRAFFTKVSTVTPSYEQIKKGELLGDVQL